jgi:FMN-dependent NADH-azoreductase
VIVTARGASYDPGTPTADWDHAVPPLRLILGESLGMEITVITVSLTLAESVPALADSIPRAQEELSAALASASALGAELGASRG